MYGFVKLEFVLLLLWRTDGNAKRNSRHYSFIKNEFFL